MHPVYLSLGSNLGNRIRNLVDATVLLCETGCIPTKVSSVYQYEAQGFTSDHLFLNMALEAKTDLTAEELLEKILHIEKQLGRVRPGNGFSDRTVDIDIIFFTDQVIIRHNLMIPHPRMQERLFVLEPLQEIAPDYVHPLLNRPVMQLFGMLGNSKNTPVFMNAGELQEMIGKRKRVAGCI